MEKITAALEKARAARAEASPTPAPSTAAADPVDAASAAWDALPTIRVETERLLRHHVVTPTGGVDSATFDIMRTKLLQQAREHGWHRIGVTSPTAGCGKTTVVLNLAFGLARQAEERVIVLDADLRRPSLAQVMGYLPTASLSDLLAGGRVATSGLVRCARNLAILGNAGPRPSPAELFQAPSAARALSDLDEALAPSIVLVDLPPMLTGDDVMAFAGHLDAVLLIAAADVTTVREIDLCERELATRTNVMGVVLNRCRYMGEDYGYATYG